MTDNLRDRIVAVQAEHVEDQLTNYNAGRNECGCGHQGTATYREHLADAVIEALGAISGSTRQNGCSVSRYYMERPTLMPDDLRDRIAAVLEHHQRVASSCECGFADCIYRYACARCGDLGIFSIAWHWRDHVADAIVAELGLQPIRRSTMFPERRWVTPWELIDPMEGGG